VFFAGADGTAANPGHVGLVIGKNTMIEAYATGFPLRISTFGLPTSPGGERYGQVVGFTRPWAHSGLNVPPSELATPTPSATNPSGTPSQPGQPTQSGQPTTLPTTAPKPTPVTTKKA
jgi:hypothetical protein